jgi:hypothetical protein
MILLLGILACTKPGFQNLGHRIFSKIRIAIKRRINVSKGVGRVGSFL